MLIGVRLLVCVLAHLCITWVSVGGITQVRATLREVLERVQTTRRDLIAELAELEPYSQEIIEICDLLSQFDRVESPLVGEEVNFIIRNKTAALQGDLFEFWKSFNYYRAIKVRLVDLEDVEIDLSYMIFLIGEKSKSGPFGSQSQDVEPLVEKLREEEKVWKSRLKCVYAFKRDDLETAVSTLAEIKGRPNFRFVISHIWNSDPSNFDDVWNLFRNRITDLYSSYDIISSFFSEMIARKRFEPGPANQLKDILQEHIDAVQRHGKSPGMSSMLMLNMELYILSRGATRMSLASNMDDMGVLGEYIRWLK